MFLMQGDIFGTIIWFVMLFILIFLYPKLMLSQLIYKIEQVTLRLETLSKRSQEIICRKVSKKPSSELRKNIEEFTDFFVISPSDLDPYGIVRKIDQTIRNMEDRFNRFVESIAGKMKYTEKKQINYALRASMGLKQIAKIVRHNLELTKKFKNLQIAMIMQMQLPIIEEIAKSEFMGTESFSKGWPVGDSIGPMVAASYISKSKEIAEDIVYGETKIKQRTCFVIKAKGPEPSLGRYDEAITRLMKKHNISRVITIDAARKLEGEKTGTVSEGVGFAMGGWSQKEIIENILLPKKKPIDSIVIKVGMNEAIMPMKKEIFNSLKKAREEVEKAVLRAKKKQNILIIGVGNSSGIGNTKNTIKEVKKTIDIIDQKYKKMKKKKKGGWF